MISCEDAVRQLWEHAQIQPTAEQAALLEAHLALCRRCCGEAGFAIELRAFLSRSPQLDLPPATAARLEALIERLEEAT